MAAGFALIAYEVYSLLGSFDDAKEQLAAINAYREQFWKEYDEEMARQKKAAKDAPPTQVVTAPPVAIATHAMLAAPRSVVFLITKIEQRRELWVGEHNDIAT